MLITGSISNLFNGVSQQSPDLRMPTQGEEMNNFYPSIVDGLIKRPPTKFIKKLLSSLPANAKIHIVNRDMDKRYIILFMEGDLKVFTMQGTECSVAFPNGKAYISASEPIFGFPGSEIIKSTPPQLSAFTVADYTFVLNKERTVRLGNTYSPSSSGVLINVKQASYDTRYTITLGSPGRLFLGIDFTPKNVGDMDHPPATIGTEQIAYALAQQLRDQGATTTGGFSITQTGSSIYIKRTDGSDNFTCTASDTRGDTHIFAAKGRIQKFSQLPSVAPNGYVVEVLGDETSAFDNYYVKFVTNDSISFGPGNWVETVKPGTNIDLDETTMPHALILQSNGTFVFKPVDWSKRTVGDTDSAPDPVFVGRKIRDMFLFRNRLGFLSDDNLTLSAASDFFRLFPETVTTIVASDPISISSSFESVTNLKHAIPFQEDLIVFSEQAQFILESPDVLSAETATLKVATTFSANLDVKPMNSGRTVFFVTPGTTFAGVREYYVDADSSTKNAANITSHVPQYIAAPIRRMACSSSEDILMLLPTNASSTLYMYKYYWSGGEKLQASWSTLSFPGANIVDIAFLESTLYLFIGRSDGLYLETIDFSATHTTSMQTVVPHLDRLFMLSNGSYSATTGRTTWTLPYNRNGQTITLVLAESMVALNLSMDSATTVSAKGDYSGRTVYGGVDYPAHYKFSEQFVRRDDGGGRISTHQGRLQFRRWSLVHGNSGYFDVTVDHVGGQQFKYPFTGLVLGDVENRLGYMTLAKGKFNFPVKSRSDRVNITVRNDTHMPSSLLSAEWEAFYTTRDRGI